MVHGFAERHHDDGKHIRVALESTMLQYGVLLGMLLLIIVLGLGIAYFQP